MEVRGSSTACFRIPGSSVVVRCRPASWLSSWLSATAWTGALNPKVQGSTPCASTIMRWVSAVTHPDVGVDLARCLSSAAFDTLFDTLSTAVSPRTGRQV